MSSSSEVQEIKDKIDIAEFIGEYLRLAPAGTGVYRGLCPFHNEKTPSFIVSPGRASWHCFGCSSGGDIFEFLMKIENIPFPEALKILAQKAGVTLTRQSPQQTGFRNRLYDICDLAARYWHKVLLSSSQAEEARQYLKRRGITDESIEKFQIGYSIDEWSNLLDFLRKRGYRDDEIAEAGLAIKKDNGYGYYDRFRHRLMFPILDAHGRTVGFGGRAMKDGEPAKYINSPQSEIYDKSSILYGLYYAKDEIRRSEQCVLVEGYMDVIPSHQAGIRNVVSISGTALTDQQLRLLSRFTANLALSLDMDEAGQRAALRSIELALEKEMNVRVITLPHGKDPGECATNDPQEWRQAIADAESVMEYFFSRAQKGRDVAKPEDKKEIAKFLAAKIIHLGSPVERDHWLKELSNRLAVSEESVRELAKRLTNAEKAAPAVRTGESKPAVQQLPAKKDSQEFSVFVRLLAIIWAQPDYLPKLAEILPPKMISEPQMQGIYKDLILFYTKSNELFTLSASQKEENSIFDQFFTLAKQTASVETLPILEQSYLLAQKDFFSLDAKEVKAEFDTIIRLIKSSYVNVEIPRLNVMMSTAEKQGNAEALKALYAELAELIKIKSAL